MYSHHDALHTCSVEYAPTDDALSAPSVSTTSSECAASLTLPSALHVAVYSRSSSSSDANTASHSPVLPLAVNASTASRKLNDPAPQQRPEFDCVFVMYQNRGTLDKWA